MLKLIKFTLIVTLFSSCQSEEEYRPKFHANTCIKEISRSYASVENTPVSIYKLEDIVKNESGPQIKVSFWHNYSWFYQGVKNFSHFKDTHLFSYESVDCPDGSNKKVGITDRLKKIDI